MIAALYCPTCKKLGGHRPSCGNYRPCWSCQRLVLEGFAPRQAEGKHEVIRHIGNRKAVIYLCDDHLKAEGMTPSEALNHHRAVEID